MNLSLFDDPTEGNVILSEEAASHLRELAARSCTTPEDIAVAYLNAIAETHARFERHIDDRGHGLN